jgi:hypothetical protein
MCLFMCQCILIFKFHHFLVTICLSHGYFVDIKAIYTFIYENAIVWPYFVVPWLRIGQPRNVSKTRHGMLVCLCKFSLHIKQLIEGSKIWNFNQLLQLVYGCQEKRFEFEDSLVSIYWHAFFIHDFNVTIFGLYLPFLRAWVPILTKELFGFYQNLWISNLNTCWWYMIQHVLSQITLSMCEYIEKFIHMNTAIQSCFRTYNVLPLFVILVVSTQKYPCNNFNHVYKRHSSYVLIHLLENLWKSESPISIDLHGVWFGNMCWINQITLLM